MMPTGQLLSFCCKICHQISLTFVQIPERLALLTEYLRTTYHYCTWCGTRFEGKIFSRPSTKNPDKSPLYKFSLNCSGVLSGGLLSGRFCPGWFLSVPLLSEYICYDRKLNITLNFMFHMYDKFFL